MVLGGTGIFGEAESAGKKAGQGAGGNDAGQPEVAAGEVAWRGAGAERGLEEGLKVAGLYEKDLRALKGSDYRNLVLAELIWKRTTVSQEWLAEKRSMRSAANVSQQLRRLDRGKVMGRVPEKLRTFLAGIRTAQE